MKRGQATLFIILGVIIVAAASLGYVFREQISTAVSSSALIKAGSLPPQFEEKKATVEGCMDAALNRAILLTSAQGGYAGKAPGGSYMLGELPIAYHFKKGMNTMPTKETVAGEIAKAMQKDAAACATAIDLPEPRTAKVKVAIADEKATATVSMPLKITIGGAAETIPEFSATTKTGLGRVLSSIKTIIEWQAGNPKNICLSCINEVAVQNGLDVSIQSQEGAVLVTVQDSKAKIEEEPLKFIFAMGY